MANADVHALEKSLRPGRRRCDTLGLEMGRESSRLTLASWLLLWSRLRLTSWLALARLLVGLTLLGAAGMGLPTAPRARADDLGNPRILVFSQTAGFRHDSIPAAIAAVRQL